MDKNLVDIVLKKSFIELSKKEHEELLEWCSTEEEFEQIKQVFTEVESIKKMQTDTVRSQTKKSLDTLFLEKRRKDSVIWNSSVVRVMYPVEKAFHRRPLVQIAALLLLLLSVYPFVHKITIISDSPQLVKNETVLNLNKNETKSQVDKEVVDAVFESKKKESEISIESNAKFEIENEILVENIVLSEQSINDKSETGFATSVNSDNLEISSNLHSDGVFLETSSTINYSQSVIENSNILDLLTVAF